MVEMAQYSLKDQDSYAKCMGHILKGESFELAFRGRRRKIIEFFLPGFTTEYFKTRTFKGKKIRFEGIRDSLLWTTNFKLWGILMCAGGNEMEVSFKSNLNELIILFGAKSIFFKKMPPSLARGSTGKVGGAENQIIFAVRPFSLFYLDKINYDKKNFHEKAEDILKKGNCFEIFIPGWKSRLIKFQLWLFVDIIHGEGAKTQMNRKIKHFFFSPQMIMFNKFWLITIEAHISKSMTLDYKDKDGGLVVSFIKRSKII